MVISRDPPTFLMKRKNKIKTEAWCPVTVPSEAVTYSEYRVSHSRLLIRAI